jgi:mRNA interferase MazF
MAASLIGLVVVINFPFSDLSGSKRRPALVVADWNSDDVILCQITSVNNNDSLAILLSNTDFSTGSLLRNSYVRPNKLFTADKRTLLQQVGLIKGDKFQEILIAIRALF